MSQSMTDRMTTTHVEVATPQEVRALVNQITNALVAQPSIESATAFLFENANAEPQVIASAGNNSQTVMSVPSSVRDAIDSVAKGQAMSATTDTHAIIDCGNRNPLILVVECTDPVEWTNETSLWWPTLRTLIASAGGISTDTNEEFADISEWNGMVGASPAAKALFEDIQRVAETHLTVIVRGETGTGKELVARAIHEESSRSDGPFEIVACGNITETLVESELFGHKKGAFSGAETDYKGAFERAHRGTLFLDEVADMSPSMQQKILRVLQENEVRPIGAASAVPVDVRVVCSTRYDLREKVAEGTFREDLFYRLDVCSIDIPPLRERGEDSLMLADHFLSEIANETGNHAKLTAGARDEIKSYSWPGNAQELKNTLTRVALQTKSGSVAQRDLAPHLNRSLNHASSDSDGFRQIGEELVIEIPYRQGFNDIVAEVERRVIIAALKRHRGNKLRATKQLRIPRQTLYNKLEKLEIQPSEYAESSTR